MHLQFEALASINIVTEGNRRVALNVECPICDSPNTSSSPFLRRRMKIGERQFDCHLVSCGNCSHVYMDPQPSPSELTAFYDEDYEVFKVPPEQGDTLLSLCTLDMDGSPHFVKGGRYLDVGCGYGNWVAAMQHHGMESCGCDLSEAAVKMGRDLGRDVRDGTLHDMSFPDNHFDSISMYHCLEHMPNPIDVLRECVRIAKPEAKIVIVVPNIEALMFHLRRGRWHHLSLPYHIQHFSPRILTLIADKAGLKVDNVFTRTFQVRIEHQIANFVRRYMFVPARLTYKTRLFLPPALCFRYIAESMGGGCVVVGRFHKPE